MANYYTKLSLVLPLPNEEANRYALELCRRADAIRSEDTPADDFPEDLKEFVEDWCFEAEDDSTLGNYGIWIHSDNGGVDVVCSFIQHLLQKFNPQGAASFEWSNDCSKPRLDAYGGGAVLVTARDIKTMSSFQWLDRQSSPTGIDLIEAERDRQVNREEWDSPHDDRHRSGELVDAAVSYARAAAHQARGASIEELRTAVPAGEFPWPWEDCWWKPSEDPIRNLEKAGALVSAEIDRLLRVRQATIPGNRAG